MADYCELVHHIINYWAPSQLTAGQYQVTDPQAISNLQRFYRISSP
jgi:hypothetical protein